MENIIELLMEHAKWVFSGIGLPVVAYLFFKKPPSQNITVKVEQSSNDTVINEEIKSSNMSNKIPLNDSYKSKVGRKHKWLRESVLKLTLREMANFYGLDEVSKIESYESGEIELPINLIDRLESFFFINSNVIDGDSPYIFNSFRLSQPSISNLFEQGFKARIACCPDDRGDLFCFIIMHKEEHTFTRIVVSDLVSSFMSSGGGRMNIQYLIEELIVRSIPDYKVSILKTTKGDWKKLEHNCYYDVGLFHRLGAADQECVNIFNSWYLETLRIRNIENHKV